MGRTFVDENLRVWEAFPSGSKRGFAERPRIIFHCTTDRTIRPRFIDADGDQADAERAVAVMPADQLLSWLKKSAEIS
jgi:hypothetical protein